MKKLFYYLVALVVFGCVALFAFETWKTTAYVRTQGREAAVVIGERYNASRWSAPLPLKKIHIYAATLAPNHGVVIESDQELVAGRQYFIRYLTRDDTPGAPVTWLRPLPGKIRLRAPDDGAPSKIDPTALLDRVVASALGTSHVDETRPNPAASHALPGRHADWVPVLFGGAGDHLLELIWKNSQPAEWLAVFFALLFVQFALVSAWAHPWRKRRSPSLRKDFQHPAMRTIAPDPPAPPVPRLQLKPSTGSAAPGSLGPEVEAAPRVEPVLKLRRKETPTNEAPPNG